MTLAPVVLDNGTGSIKCGCAGVSPLPLVICPTVVGRPHVDAFALHTLLHSPHYNQNGNDDNDAGPLSAERMHRTLLLQKEVLCGDELVGLRGSAELTYPIQNGVLHNMEAMQELWDYVLCQRLPRVLSASGGNSTSQSRTSREEDNSAAAAVDSGLAWWENRPLLLTESPNLAMKQRCDMMELFFEEYRVGVIQSTPQGILSLFANGAERGVVVECGEGLTHCTPVFDGFVLTTAQRRVDLGGRAVTEHLAQLLCEQQQYGLWGGSTGKNNSTPLTFKSSTQSTLVAASAVLGERGGGSDDIDTFRRLKERYCYVSADHAVDQRLARDTNALQRSCVLPDGARCRLNAERFTAPEVLFDPSLIDVESPGVSSMLWDCIEAADIDVRKSLYENIILSGGSSLFPGFGARITKDMKALYLTEKLKGDVSRMTRCPIQVKEPPRRQHMVFIGGALMAELSADQPAMWMSRKEYDEGGTSAIVARYQSVA